MSSGNAIKLSSNKGGDNIMRMILASVMLSFVICNVLDVFSADNAAMLNAARDDNFELMKQLKDQGADVNARDDNGMTPICWTAYYNNLEAMKWLIDQGADANAKDRFGNTPISYAKQNKHDQAVKLLLENGADSFGLYPAISFGGHSWLVFCKIHLAICFSFINFFQ